MIGGPLPSNMSDYRTATDKARPGERLVDMWVCRRCHTTGVESLTPVRCPKCGSWSTGKIRYARTEPTVGNPPGAVR